ncbi:hypothetical protein B0H10DRAFT_1151244 [Mycena sp. CBHHK59/15]|nr:hypothetical protein B0H10DRAFT_1151244 [Mycena sp. CBHHK59/15]
MLKTHWRLCVYAVLLMTGFNFLSHGSQDLYPTYLTKSKGIATHAATIIGNCVHIFFRAFLFSARLRFVFALRSTRYLSPALQRGVSFLSPAPICVPILSSSFPSIFPLPSSMHPASVSSVPHVRVRSSDPTLDIPSSAAHSVHVLFHSYSHPYPPVPSSA